MKLDLLYADNHVVAASPNKEAIGYCLKALELEGRHEVRVESVELAIPVPMIGYKVVNPDQLEDTGGPYDPLPDFSWMETLTTYNTPVTRNLTDTVNTMRQVIGERLVNPFDTGE